MSSAALLLVVMSLLLNAAQSSVLKRHYDRYMPLSLMDHDEAIYAFPTLHSTPGIQGLQQPNDWSKYIPPKSGDMKEEKSPSSTVVLFETPLVIGNPFLSIVSKARGIYQMFRRSDG